MRLLLGFLRRLFRRLYERYLRLPLKRRALRLELRRLERDTDERLRVLGYDPQLVDTRKFVPRPYVCDRIHPEGRYYQ